ncbi:hypothetical protein Phi47:1_gp35 [Cellulophaga phage phi47:1]|uniref:hypothetical protein n=1 Tax=Cellulophaga phage phiSM TaxID=756280 RepID=UPI0002B79206|nr:hypothetical protein CEPG_00035 [Cellulophaga phage phiSM]AGF91635.1 hypothetical protein CDPG_00031 [Cellulophaga phage phi47:1]AGO47766.1 hypothetical protein Phi3ST:2_gp35 [Cellulophaga phage phi3ST:2]AGO49274.1 hypothetical protein Phi38:2_gp35 [Cellulophaga phage phi38:2]AGO49354.1 hypothetical protein Phi3:1_gp35 [Cellulophaga phage phi3:1]AGH07783.1 hypothetical protein CEPG_00035 [Cellulophaga phage phiSM]
MEKKYVIGFATVYYTLWNITKSENYEWFNGKSHLVSVTTNFNYMQNLSMNEDEAVDKIKSKFNLENVFVDDDLRGETRSFKRLKKIALPYQVFPFGLYKGSEIMLCESSWQLNRVYQEEGADGGADESQMHIKRRRVLARKRLIELGELFKTKDGYLSKREIDHRIKVESSSFLHEDKEKVILSLKTVHATGFESQYGYVHIRSYISDNGNGYVYKGTTPPGISDNEFTKVKATIKHNEYKGLKQTLIQRVKVI